MKTGAANKPNGQNVGYVRVSTADQNPERQYKAFEDRGIALDKTFTDFASGRTANRPQWKACLEYLRDGDTLYTVHPGEAYLKVKKRI